MKPLSYPPPWQDAATLCAHICIGERTLDAWVREGLLPPARLVKGKRMWKWTEVERCLEGDASLAPNSPEQTQAERIRHATRQAATPKDSNRDIRQRDQGVHGQR